jgi:hypothetical protein
VLALEWEDLWLTLADTQGLLTLAAVLLYPSAALLAASFPCTT